MTDFVIARSGATKQSRPSESKAEYRGGDVTLQTMTVEISPRRMATMTLNRPERGNAFDQRMLDELAEQCATLGADDRIRVVVLRGAGRHFCTGADLAARGDKAEAAPAAKPATLRDVLVALDTLPKPTIAVVHGGAVGGGAAFAVCCDVAIATEQAFFSIPEVRVGMPPMGVMPFLVRAMGHRNFRRYGLSGERITPAEALRIGLVHCVCEAAALDDTLARIADELLHGAPGALAELKAAAARFASPNLDAILGHHAPHNAKSPEALEGIASFREKRKPSWYPQ
jgi:methylglutaconyl-CoA hydratase